jgi:hypothetical protein
MITQDVIAVQHPFEYKQTQHKIIVILLGVFFSFTMLMSEEGVKVETFTSQDQQELQAIEDDALQGKQEANNEQTPLQKSPEVEPTTQPSESVVSEQIEAIEPPTHKKRKVTHKSLNIKLLKGFEAEVYLSKNLGLALNTDFTPQTTDYKGSDKKLGSMFGEIKTYLYANQISSDSLFVAPFYSYGYTFGDSILANKSLWKLGANLGYIWHWKSGFNISWQIGYSYVGGDYLDAIDPFLQESAPKLSSDEREVVANISTFILGFQHTLQLGWAF